MLFFDKSVFPWFLIGHCSVAVPYSGGRGIGHDAEDGEDGKDGVDEIEQAGLQRLHLGADAEEGTDRLDQEQDGGDQGIVLIAIPQAAFHAAAAFGTTA